MTSVTAVQLDEDLTAKILDSLPSKMSQGRRLFQYLADNPKASSGYVSHNCSIGNISDVAFYVNPYLRKHQLMIGCQKPLIRILNKFKEQSNQFNWSIYQVPEAANDGGQLSNDE
jgi:hypothetical protein